MVGAGETWLSVLFISNLTIEYMEMFPYQPPNSPARHVSLIFCWGC
jgi:hypothetical protein